MLETREWSALVIAMIMRKVKRGMQGKVNTLVLCVERDDDMFVVNCF